MEKKKDWLFGFLEDAGVAQVVYAEDEGKVTINKYPLHPLCPLCGKELWPLMDKGTLPDGRQVHAYCLTRYHISLNDPQIMR